MGGGKGAEGAEGFDGDVVDAVVDGMGGAGEDGGSGVVIAEGDGNRDLERERENGGCAKGDVTAMGGSQEGSVRTERE